MFKNKEIIYLKALTPVHAGAGQTLENVDMPIQRERHSNIPKIEASTLKGAIKHSLYNKFKDENGILLDNDKNNLYTIFGPEESGEEYASSIGFTDAKLLFFSIKSATNIFKLITCPYIISRWMEDLSFQDVIYENEKFRDEIKIDEGMCLTVSDEKNVVLEDYIFKKYDKKKCEDIISIFKDVPSLDVNRIVILNDSDFIDLVTMYTEIITRNQINVKTGTAEDTGLFTEEYLPTETILYFIVLASPSFNEKNILKSEEVLEYFYENVDKVFQVGGNATIGKGFVRRFRRGEKDEQSKKY